MSVETEELEETATGTMPANPSWLRVELQGAGTGAEVDRQARVIRGAILASEGPFREPNPRGEFDAKGLKMIVEQVNARKLGLKTRFGHHAASSDSLGKFIGRSKNARLGTVTVDQEDGRKKLKCVRGDLHISETAFSGNPNGDLGNYIMNLAEEDPTAMAMSLVIEPNEEVRLEKDGTRKKDAEGNPLPPLWHPKRLHAVDLVDEGAATDGLLSAELWTQALSVGMTPELQKVLNFDNAVRLGSHMLDAVFAGQERAVVEARLTAFLERYLNRRYGTVLQMDDTEGDDNELDVGDLVKILTPHAPKHKTGTIRQVVENQCALGIEIDGTGEIAQWYLESEVMLLEDEAEPANGANMAANETDAQKAAAEAAEVQKAAAERQAKLVELGANLTHDSKTADSEPAWSSVDKGKLPMVAFADHGDGKDHGSFKYPHHFVTGGSVGDDGVYKTGTLWLHKGGLNSAWAAANGARSGQEASAAVKSHLQRHRRALGLGD